MTGTAIITGGAGGIAGELAPLLLKRGFRLLLLDRDERRLSERAQTLGGGVRCVTAVGRDSAAARSNNATRAHPDRVKFPAVTSPQLRPAIALSSPSCLPP